MKKLITLASVAMLSCAATAASFTWGFTSDKIRDSTGSFISGGTAFLYLGAVTASDTAFSLSDATFLALAGQDGESYQFGNLDAPISSESLASDAVGQAFTLILLEKTGITSLDDYDGHYILASGTSGKDIDPMTLTTWATFTNATAFTSADWKTMSSSVPEPTSGLLMLLGMAGLALKRKQA